MKAKKFIVGVLTVAAVLLLGCALFVAVIDPYFHFHKPLKSLEYPLNNEYYQNAGIARNFDFEAAIIGNSMTQHFKTSQAEELWGVNFVKLPNPGALYTETDMFVRSVLRYNSDCKLIIRQLDNFMFVRDAYSDRYTKADYYLLDENPFNDVKYLLNKEIFVDAFTVLTYTKSGKTTTSFDMYSNENRYKSFGNKSDLEEYFSRSQAFHFEGDKEEVVNTAVENVEVNVIRVALDNPDVEFLLFVPPYSGAYWKEIINAGAFENEIATEYVVLSKVLEVPNIKVFYYMDEFDIATDWTNYSDELHFTDEVSEYILNSIYEEEKMLTKENYTEKIESVRDFYSSYDFEKMLENLE